MKKAKIPDIKKTFENLKKQAIKVGRERLREVAEEGADAVRNGIRRQSFRHVPLSESRKDRKRRKNLDPRILIAHGDYASEIKVVETKDPNVLHVGFDGTEKMIDDDGYMTDVTMEYVAAIHEHGSAKAGIPARPHFRIIAERLRRKYKGKKR